jgi:hypothetical protein
MSQSTDNNIENLRKWFRDCPLLPRNNPLRVDFLAEEPDEYAVISVPSTIRYHENVLGEDVPNDIQTLQFIFASRNVYGADERQNIENYGFYQAVTLWIVEQNANRNLPELAEGRVLSVKPTLSQYVSAPGTDSARYQIQIEVKYKYHG